MLDKPTIVLIASLLASLGGWGASFTSWAQVAQPSNLFALVGIIAGVLLAWVGTSPRNGNGINK